MDIGEETGMRNDRPYAADPLRAGCGREGVRSAIRDEGRKMRME
jgi:hypothetical protein